MSLPENISPCPILDALIEIRFSTNINSNAVFGLIYNSLQSDFGSVESLPILQIPDVVRNSDPNFRYKPHYKVSNSQIVVQIGPDVISISSFPEYIGWESFSSKIFNILDKVEKVGIIKSVERIGIRYINFFENSIFDKINLKVSICDNNISYKNTIVRTEIEQKDFYSTLQIANNAINNGKVGSIIDIDTFTTNNLTDFFSKKVEIINAGHLKEKELFFELLQKDFLNSLNPNY